MKAIRTKTVEIRGKKVISISLHDEDFKGKYKISTTLTRNGDVLILLEEKK